MTDQPDNEADEGLGAEADEYASHADDPEPGEPEPAEAEDEVSAGRKRLAEQARARIEKADDGLAEAGRTPEPASGDLPWYGSAEEYVRCFLRWFWQVQIDHNRRFWAPDWWAYEEPVAVFTELWRSFEAARAGGGGDKMLAHYQSINYWMETLTSPDGPFRLYTDVETDGNPLKPLPIAALPKDCKWAILVPHGAHQNNTEPGPGGDWPIWRGQTARKIQAQFEQPVGSGSAYHWTPPPPDA